MRGEFLVLVGALILAGCNAAPEADRVTPGPPAQSAENASGETREEAPETLVDGENDDLRIRVTSHLADATTTRIVTQAFNKRADDVVLNYAILDTEAGGQFWFELNARIPAGEERTVTAEDASGDLDDRRARWTQLTFYYTKAFGTPEASDDAATLDLRGRGMPG